MILGTISNTWGKVLKGIWSLRCYVFVFLGVCFFSGLALFFWNILRSSQGRPLIVSRRGSFSKGTFSFKFDASICESRSRSVEGDGGQERRLLEEGNR